MSVLTAVLLGLVQGIAEFLPISSSGHLAIAEHLLSVQGASNVPDFFDVLLHLGTLVAVFIAYWDDIRDMIVEFFAGIGDLAHHSTPNPVPPARRLILLIIVGVMANNFLPEAFPFFANGAGIPIFEEIVFPYSTLVEIILILTAAQLSIHTTPANIHKENQFSMNPIKGVAVLFSGIFVTMIPALVLLETHGSALGINQPWQMFWIMVISAPAW